MVLTLDKLILKISKLQRSYKKVLEESLSNSLESTYELGYERALFESYTFFVNSLEELRKHTTFESNQLRPPGHYIFRRFETRLSTAKLGPFIRDVARCNATIVDSFFGKNAFPPDKAGYWTGLFKLKFKRESDLHDFHKLGYTTTEPLRLT